MVSHQNLPTLRYLKEPAPVGEMELDHTVHRSGASIVPANPAEKPTKIPLLICDFDVPWRFFFSTTNLEPTQRIQHVTVSEFIRIHPSNILLVGKTDVPKPEVSSVMKTRSLNLSTQLLTLEESNHLDSASQATPGYAAIPSTVMTLAQRLPVWGCLIQLQAEILVSTKSGRQNATKLQPQNNVNLLPRISLVK